jgi:hypothetical protein
MDESLRRTRLRELDEILDALEQLNLRDDTTISDALQDRMRDLGVHTPPRVSVTQLIERVWELQEEFLSPSIPGSESHRSSSLRRSRRV